MLILLILSKNKHFYILGRRIAGPKIHLPCLVQKRRPAVPEQTEGRSVPGGDDQRELPTRPVVGILGVEDGGGAFHPFLPKSTYKKPDRITG